MVAAMSSSSSCPTRSSNPDRMQIDLSHAAGEDDEVLVVASSSKFKIEDQLVLKAKPTNKRVLDLTLKSSPSNKGKELASHDGNDDDDVHRDDNDDDDDERADPVDANELGEDEKHIGRVEDGLDEDEDIVIGQIPLANVKGTQHYGGVKTLKPGMKLEFKRDRTNLVDPQNAIAVSHARRGAKIGMVAKGLAARLAPLLDENLIELEGVAGEVDPKGTHMITSITCCISIWGKRSVGRDPRLDWLFPSRAKRATMLARATKSVLANHNNHSNDLKMSRGGSTASSNGGPMMSDQEKLKQEVLMMHALMIEKDRRAVGGDPLSELFKEGGLDPSRLPMHPCPPGKKDKTMRTDLMPFQKQGLAWMIRMEHPRLPRKVDDPPVQLWQRKIDPNGEPFFYNVATELMQREKPLLKRGGVLADEMGLGKTLTTIALITTDDTGDGVLDEPEDPDDRFDDMTLIVCPLSVASNWTSQLHTHVGSKRLKWHLYHGDGRSLTKKQLRNFDVVIATYQTLAAEISDPNSSRATTAEADEENGGPDKKKAKVPTKKHDTLHQIKWRRVVLDEGHVIKNPKAKMTIACTTLIAERRWVLTGTPIVNSSDDLGAIMSFLRMCKPLDNREEWLKYVGDGKNATESSAKILRAIVASTTLCRTKDMKDSTGKLLVTLPKILFYELRVELDPDTRALYDEIQAQLKDIVRTYMKKDTINSHYQDVLVMLLRLRQLACDPSLCPESFLEAVRERQLARSLEKSIAFDRKLDRAELSELQMELRQQLAHGGTCLICGETPNDPRLTLCKHLYCSPCIEGDERRRRDCPMCRTTIDYDQLIELDGAVSETASLVDEAEVLERQKKEGARATSPKIARLITLLRADPTAKSLVFSQWTTHLNCIEVALEQAGITSCRFDGSMTQAKREDMIKAFSKAPPAASIRLKKGEKPPPTVMLISLKAGALGLNLTCANQVFLMDPWWQASIETQAIDRCYRIGQTREVKVFQLIAENTVEDRVLEIQNRKNERISEAFSGNKDGFKARQKVQVRKLDDILHVLDM
ncbi:BZ3500_MvSof-1268-A1-R1_Chr2-1g04630 [Microbotryum saponariae]|uniref:BZ3500_MvSof-1268-A1-R1_Chr2-1g04630 protein n=1 Tax=Microbotryum saponariae TaxID=289078 RepID=A0A2X0MDB7_9BASI|nr:BZ3500_MvSof-1268-A1-R1_Chr2-1g04630 [Microbotryum saponariae]SCZ92150.1 BZ3501_MvSof-1269-A2-R1_Chr2-1g04286 [Microbotryum saponariae]